MCGPDDSKSGLKARERPSFMLCKRGDNIVQGFGILGGTHVFRSSEVRYTSHNCRYLVHQHLVIFLDRFQSFEEFAECLCI